MIKVCTIVNYYLISSADVSLTSFLNGLMHVLEKLSHSHEMPFALRNFTVSQYHTIPGCKISSCSNGQNFNGLLVNARKLDENGKRHK